MAFRRCLATRSTGTPGSRCSSTSRRAIVSLPSEMRRLCACLAHETPGVARRVCNLSNAGMYRQIEALRLHLLAFGFGTL